MEPERERERDRERERERERDREGETERLARVSHDLRTPLNTILGAVELLARSDLSPAQQRHLAMLKRGAERLAAVVETLVDRDAVEAAQGGGLLRAAPPRPPIIAPADALEGGHRLQGARVLVVDDSEDTRALVEEFLASTGVILTFAQTGAAALEALSLAIVHLVLMDLSLPDASGLDTTRALRLAEQQRGAGAVPVVALTADTRATVAQQALSAGCAALLGKPFTRAALLAAIAAHCRPVGRSPSPALRLRFLANRVREVATARDALARGDLPWLETLGHKLRGNGASYGFPQLSALGKRIEDAARARDPRRLGELLAGLGLVFREPR